MKTTTSTIIVILMAVLFTACKKDIISGRGSIISQERMVTGFVKVKIEGSTNVEIMQGSSFKVIVSDYENLVNELETFVIANELIIKYKNNVAVLKGKSKVTIIMPDLNGLKTYGSGDFLVKGIFNTAVNFSALIDGSGNMQFGNMKFDNLDLRISGSGSISFENSNCNNSIIKIDGSGDVNGYSLSCKLADIDVSGSGRTRISVTDNLKVKISGSGNVYYRGNPSINSNISGSGKVIKD